MRNSSWLCLPLSDGRRLDHDPAGAFYNQSQSVNGFDFPNRFLCSSRPSDSSLPACRTQPRWLLSGWHPPPLCSIRKRCRFRYLPVRSASRRSNTSFSTERHVTGPTIASEHIMNIEDFHRICNRYRTSDRAKSSQACSSTSRMPPSRRRLRMERSRRPAGPVRARAAPHSRLCKKLFPAGLGRSDSPP